MTFPLKPLFNNVIIKLIEKESEAGLILPQGVSDGKMGESNTYEVMAVGPGRGNAGPVVEVGDKVYLISTHGTIGLEYGAVRDLTSNDLRAVYFSVPDTSIGGVYLTEA